MVSLHWIPFSECFAFHRKKNPKLTDRTGHRCVRVSSALVNTETNPLTSFTFDPNANVSCEVGKFCQSIVGSALFRKTLTELGSRLEKSCTSGSESPVPVPVPVPKPEAETTTTTTSKANVDLPTSAQISDDK